MPSTPGQRVAGIIVLVVCLGGLLIWFGSLAPNPAVGAYPGGHELGTNYDAYLDESVVVGGIVVETDPLTIAVEYGVDEVIELRVVDENTQLEATQGDHVTLFGTAKPDQTVIIEHAYAVPGEQYLYMYLVSFGGGLWVLTRIVRTWRFDRNTWSLVPDDENSVTRGDDA
ncbi:MULTISPECIES: hypothetical protein [Haloferax]|uniref:hypothetical protein n=1 Tax=Haloferax TaxID=2251 RepID=UPI000E23303A|nr:MULTISPECIES: hypothetical protein [Haloferax]RDZ35275.1 hypothetical protein C5B88_12745 [Haloferax sp. Atlit-24N]RLM35686.1 hypothetical protein DVK03_12755 [Haloferax sp. Atlit-109R]RLM43534.1 hypothetical protein DVK04_12755 [Haloferax sp. Atlit-105R]WEL26806.1 Membrane associated OB-fold protein [Haloferax lucentense]